MAAWAYTDEVKDFSIDRDEYPHYHIVEGLSIAENIRFRNHLLRDAIDSHELREDLRVMCEEDTLFWLNTFCWLFEPRPDKADPQSKPRIVPFVMWPNQLPCFVDLERALGQYDVGLEKARGEGASWMALMLVLKYWMFVERSSFGLVSRTEEAVDAKDDPDCLMWKLDFQLEQQPFWLRPNSSRSISTHTLKNLDNHATIVGYSATGDVASGGRKTAFVMDEMAKFPSGSDYDAMSSTQYVTNCRMVVSTFKGNSGAYFDAMRGASSLQKVVLDWKDNPTRNKGLYVIQNGKFRSIDQQNNPMDPDYPTQSRDLLEQLRNRGYRIENVPRSPWYDNECARTSATPASIAEELDRDPTRSGSPFFDPTLIEELMRECIPPLITGDMDYTKQSLEPVFKESPKGKFKLWCKLTEKRRPADDRDYVMGCDIAAGTGGALSSNSTLTVADRLSRMKVAEFATPAMPPHEFANLVIAVGKWFSGPNGWAYLIYESNGPTGAQFTKAIMELKYPSVFHREDETKYGRKKSRKPGFHNQGEPRGILYGRYHAALSEHTFINLSRDSLKECLFYENQPGGGIEHVSAVKSMDPSGAGHNHGDRATADALCNRGLADFPKPTRKHQHQTGPAPIGSFLHRRESHAKKLVKSDEW